jgi:hypothetical protein
MNKLNVEVPMVANQQVGKCPSHGIKLIMTYTIMQQSLGSDYIHIIVMWLSHEQVKCRGPSDG